MRGRWKLAISMVLTAMTLGAQTSVSIRRGANGNDELWIADRMLATARKFSSPQFSPNDSYLYVLTDIGPATRVLQRIELATGTIKRFMADVSRFAFIETGPNRGRLLVSRRMPCFMEESRQSCFPVLLLTLSNSIPGQSATGKMVAKDDAEFDESLQQLSR
jgi:hypothetical protein